MSARYRGAVQWSTGIVLTLTLWWGWQLHSTRTEYEILVRQDLAIRQRLAHAGSTLAEVQRSARGTLESLSGATHTLKRLVAQLQRQGRAVTMTCQEQTAFSVAALRLAAVPCRLMVPLVGLVSLIEVLTAIEQTQSLLQLMRIHVTEGTTIDLQLYGRGALTPTEIGERTAR